MPRMPSKQSLRKFLDALWRKRWGWRFLLFSERFLIIAGILAVGTYAASKLHSSFYQAYDHWAFNQALKGESFSIGGFLGQLVDFSSKKDPSPQAPPAITQPDLPRQEPVFREEAPNKRGWSIKRVRAYETSVGSDAIEPIARLEIPAIDLSVMVLEGTDELTLNRAVGRIEGTALPGEPGNVGIAGHRDSFFRGLKDLSKDDLVRVTTLSGVYQYRVEDIEIVKPTTLRVLKDSSSPTLTLVTCYPFYYVGDAPKRFIVKARLDSPGETSPAASVQTASLIPSAPRGNTAVRSPERPGGAASLQVPPKSRPSPRLNKAGSRKGGVKAGKSSQSIRRASSSKTVTRQSFPKRLGRGVVKVVKSPIKLFKPRNRPAS
jgi:sortase A